MKIRKATYDEILASLPDGPPEAGGIFGGKDGIVNAFMFDEGLRGGNPGSYCPDTKHLNDCLRNWRQNGIAFYGIVHSHFQAYPALSGGDKLYIQAIMKSMPARISCLYFPIVLPRQKMVSFKAVRSDDAINIVGDDVKIL